MQRYFVEQKNIDLDQQQVTIVGDDVGHISKVMRSAVGDPLICCDGQGRCYLVRIERIDREQVLTKITEELVQDRELPVEVTIAQALPKGDKMELVIQKGTELGAHRFIPFVSARTIVQLDGKKEHKRLERWGKIAKEAAEQSHRQRLPLICPVHSWQQLLEVSKQFDVTLFAYEKEQTRTIHQRLSEGQDLQKILVIIGPEGGFSEQEVRDASEYGMDPVMLGKRILRTETAALYALSCISYYYEQFNRIP